MGTSLSRFTEYYARHGFTATIGRVRVALSRAVFANRMIVFYCDLSRQPLPAVTVPRSFKIDRLQNASELSRQDLEIISSLWNPKLARQNMEERFAKGAQLWIVRCEGQLAGYCWTVKEKTIGPYYFPMASGDVQLFDFYVIRRFRGGAVLWFLISFILHVLKAEGGARAYGDAAEWNQASLAFYRMTPFRRLGVAKSFTIFGHKFTSWTNSVNKKRVLQAKKDRKSVPAIASPHEG